MYPCWSAVRIPCSGGYRQSPSGEHFANAARPTTPSYRRSADSESKSVARSGNAFRVCMARSECAAHFLNCAGMPAFMRSPSASIAASSGLRKSQTEAAKGGCLAASAKTFVSDARRASDDASPARISAWKPRARRDGVAEVAISAHAFRATIDVGLSTAPLVTKLASCDLPPESSSAEAISQFTLSNGSIPGKTEYTPLGGSARTGRYVIVNGTSPVIGGRISHWPLSPA